MSIADIPRDAQMQVPLQADAVVQPGSDVADTASALLHPGEGAEFPMITTAELGALLQQSEPLVGGDAPMMAYDGHVALALDPGMLPDLDAALDGLTSSHLLFDVPAIDAAFSADDGAS